MTLGVSLLALLAAVLAVSSLAYRWNWLDAVAREEQFRGVFRDTYERLQESEKARELAEAKWRETVAEGIVARKPVHQWKPKHLRPWPTSESHLLADPPPTEPTEQLDRERLAQLAVTCAMFHKIGCDCVQTFRLFEEERD